MGFFNFLMGHGGVKMVRNYADGMRPMQKGSRQQKKGAWALAVFFDGLSWCSPLKMWFVVTLSSPEGLVEDGQVL